MVAIPIIIASLHFGTVMPSYGNDQCRYLEQLNRQYAGVALSAQQQTLKRQLVAWYRRHCISVARS